MDLINLTPGMAGKRHHVENYILELGPDAVVHNVPSEIAAILLKNPEVWKLAPAGAKPHVVLSSASPAGGPIRRETVEVALVPKSLALLESTERDKLAELARVFGVVDLELEAADVPTMARAILAQADLELVKQLESFLQGPPSEAGETAPETPPPAVPEPVPAPSGGGKRGRKAAAAEAPPSSEVSTLEDP